MLLFPRTYFILHILIALYCEGVGLPTFRRVACPEEDSTFHLCVNVHYQDTEGSHDLIVARVKPNAPTVLKGHLKSSPKIKVAIILADEDATQDTVSITLEYNKARMFSNIVWRKHDVNNKSLT